MRKVFLDELPRKGNLIDWVNSVGRTVKFQYDDILGELNIVDYDKIKKKLLIQYNTLEPSSIALQSMKECHIACLIGVKLSTHKYQINEIVDTNNNGQLKIVNQIKVPNGGSTKRGYEYECVNCKCVNFIDEYDLNNLVGCPVCAGRIAHIGISDMWTTNPIQAKLLLNPSDGYKYTQRSSQYVDWKCSDCGEIIKRKKISDIFRNGLSCPKCSDGISYPEKFMYNFLKQLKVDFKYQYSPEWIEPKKYDFYFELNNNNYIIETDGAFHGNDNKMNGQTAEENIAIDKYKDDMAKQNNINMIRVDTKISEIEYIKHAIQNSELANLFDISNINWSTCHEYGCSSFVKIASQYWKNGIQSTLEISKIMDVARNTVTKYLKQGATLGLSDYSTKKLFRPVVQLDCNTLEKINIFESASEAGRNMGCTGGAISICCHGGTKTCKAYKWIFLDDYNNQMLNK